MDKDAVKVSLSVNNETTAPITKGQVIGKISVEQPGKEVIAIDLIALEEVAQMGFFEGLFAKAKRAIGKE
jgi:D-alanyl-D-alanine carboxypeptidase